MLLAALLICSYLLGSIPFGLLIGALHGIDIRKVGSGNIGATNIARALGRKWAYLCFVLDFLKGFLPVLIAPVFLSDASTMGGLLMRLGIGCAAVLGHIFPVYLRFKGGKGVATSFGVAMGLWPYYTISAAVALFVWIIFVLIWRYISLASLAAAIAFPISLIIAIAIVPGWEFGKLWPLLIVAIVIPFLVFLRHRENIKRLINGTENKIFQKNNNQ
jgi:glycerol-3-phosphate acyltransferase PlsY